MGDITIPLAALGAIVTTAGGWIGAMWLYRDRKVSEKNEHHDRLEMHRDDLTFELLQAARGEVNVAYTEMKGLREEVRTLRALEQHFFHFQQALDHLEAILFAETPAARSAAERSAKAFLKRMRRLDAAKGTLRNEAQLAESIIRVTQDGLEDVTKDPLGPIPDTGEKP